MNDEIARLRPEVVWKIFAAICDIPRASGNEAAIREYLRSSGERAGLRCKVDQIGNLLIEKPASLGWGGRRTVILQAHLDMVPQCKSGMEFDFDHDPIPAVVKDGWVVAENTTLGADNGIGVALAMAAMLSEDFNHCALKAIFTVEEETGLRGAFGIPAEWVRYPHMLINLDSEEIGKLYIGCAGGARSQFTLVPQWESAPTGELALKATASGLSGGHSGAEIDKGRGNAVKLLAEFMAEAETLGARLAEINGGNRDNVIPRDAAARFTLPLTHRDELKKLAEEFTRRGREKLGAADPNFVLTLENAPAVEMVFSRDFQTRLLAALLSCTHGVVAMSDRVPGLVETSNNLAAIQTAPDMVLINTSQRSAVDTKRRELTAHLADMFEKAGAVARVFNEYPGWEPNPHSALVGLFQDAAEKVLGRPLEVTAIHAGLECGIIGSLNHHLDMVSVGPEMEGVHAPGERVNIVSVGQCWEMLKLVLENA